MSKGLVEGDSLIAIANSIRTKTGDSDTYTPSEMADAILSISNGSSDEKISEIVRSNFSEKKELNRMSVEHGYFDSNTNTLKISQESENRLVVYPVAYGSDYAIFRELKDESYYIVELAEEIHDGVSAIPVYNLAQNGWNGYYYTPSSVNIRYIAVNCVYLSSTHNEENIIDALHVCRGLYDFNSYFIGKRGPYKTVKQNLNIAALSTVESISNLYSDAVFANSESFALPFPIVGQPTQDNPHNIASINFIQSMTNSDVLSAIEEIGGYTSKTTIGYSTGYNNDETMAIKLFTYRSAIANSKNSFSLHAKKILVTAGVHGNEKGAVYSLINFIRLLNSNNPSVVNTILNNYDIDIIPCVNPWGFNTESRKNPSGVDLNRNFHYGWDGSTNTEKGSAPLSESESAAVAQVITENQYDYIVDWHEASLSNGTYVATENVNFAKVFFDMIRAQFESIKLRFGSNPVQAQGQGVAERNTLPSLANEMLATSGINNGTIFEQAWGGSAAKWSSANICIGLECFVNYLLNLCKYDKLNLQSAQE